MKNNIHRTEFGKHTKNQLQEIEDEGWELIKKNIIKNKLDSTDIYYYTFKQVKKKGKMVKVKVKIQSLKDALAGMVLVDDMELQYSKESKDLTVCILEGGTVNGKTSLMFILKMPNGSYTHTEITAELFNGIAKALEGAEQRFKDET